MRRTRYWLSGAIALALIASACSDGVVTGAGLSEAPTVKPSPTITKTRASKNPRPVASTPTDGTLRVVVQDEDDLDPRPGVIVSYSGNGRSGELTTGAEGVAKIKLPEGDYRVQVVAGCHSRLEVFKGTGGNAGVTAGETTSARMTVKARRRHWGATPLQHDVSPPWHTGVVVIFRYRLYDRCKDIEAPGKAINDIKYKTSSNLEIVGKPAAAADSKSDVVLKLRCKADGNAGLTMFDPDNDEDTIDLLSLRPPTIEPSHTWCGS